MALYLRGKTWWVRFTAPTGQRVRRSTKTSDKQKAREFHDRLSAELWRTQVLHDKPNRVWEEAAERWLAETQHKADHGKDASKLRWLSRHLDGRALRSIDSDTVRELSRLKRLEAGPTTVNRYLALLRAVLRRAAREWGWLVQAPPVRLSREPKRRIRWLTRREAKRLLEELPEHQADLARFALATGLRKANVVGLKWEQIDLHRGVAWVHPDEAKGRKAIAVPLNRDAVYVVRKQVGRHKEFVFTYNGRPVKQVNTRAWKSALKRAGIEEFRWHDLRHTWASWHVQSGTPLHVLQELGGWETVEMVRRYAHLAPEHLAEHAVRVEWGHKSDTVRNEKAA